MPVFKRLNFRKRKKINRQIYLDRQTDRHRPTDRQTDRETGRQAGRQADSQTGGGENAR